MDKAISPNPAKGKEQEVKEAFRHFILEEDHPCIMAQTVFSMDEVDFHIYPAFASEELAPLILKDLEKYIASYDFESNNFLTFIAAFPEQPAMTEQAFEERLWKQLQLLHEADGQPWDEAVSNNPEDSNFSFSLAGKAFYIVGMHPDSSRMARRSPVPAIAFNLHWQFQKLREMDTYELIRDKIRKRDEAQQGSINPMMEDFGERSEARQYSGQKVGEEWKCPFMHKS